MSRDFPVKGLVDLDKFLSALPANMQKAAYRQGLTAAAAVIRDEARVLASGFSGKVAKAIKSGNPRQNQDGSFSIRVYVDEKMPDGYLGLFAEYGVRPHTITLQRDSTGKAGKNAAARAAAGGKLPKAFRIGDRYVSGPISHPGHSAHPFLIPTLDLKSEEAVAALGTKIAAYLENKTGFAAPVDLAEAA